jgi:maltooligosyltrehalose trehalohydrolase
MPDSDTSTTRGATRQASATRLASEAVATRARRLPVGAEVVGDQRVHFRVWAPGHDRVAVVIERSTGAPSAEPAGDRDAQAYPLARADDGYFSALVDGVGAGALYRYRLDDGDPLPDPASRYQPRGPHGASCVVDPSTFAWHDQGFAGVKLQGQVIYEMHVGTYTPQGTFAAAMARLDEVADLGVTIVEVMPIADFVGEFGWGYDGVCLYAPTRLYGTPDDFRRFVDAAHARGLAVILDVVYNHLGAEGNVLPRFSADYFRRDEPTEWGDAINFDGAHAEAVREFFASNAAYWIDDFHLDGLRLDATHSIRDRSPTHVLREIALRARRAANGKDILLFAENEPQEIDQVRAPEAGGLGLDAMWNDDFHHSAHVALTGRDEGYYTDYRGNAQEFVSMAKYGFLYQGQWYKWQQQRRGTPALHVPPARFVVFIENHDQVANTARGQRLHALTSPGRLRAMTALLLLAPQTPMLFQGQEFASSAPFLFFADHRGDLANAVREGRMAFLSQFPSAATQEMQDILPSPDARETFARCVLDHTERARNAHVLALHRDLLRLRSSDPCFRQQRQGGVDGAVLGPAAFVLRYFGADGDDRLLCVNLGTTAHLDPAPEPLLAPPEGGRWNVAWSSEAPRYGGHGLRPVDASEADRAVPTGTPTRTRPRENWCLPGECAVVLLPVADGS